MRLRIAGRQIEVRENAIDRVISWFDPQRGIERLRARAALSVATGAGGYEGGRRNRRGTKRWRPPEASADADILPDLPDLRARSRDLERNFPIATGAISTGVTNVVGDGLQLQAAIDREVLGISDGQADQMEREQEREFELFCCGADFTRVQPFSELQALCFGATLGSGDVFVIRRYRQDAGEVYGTKLQVIEADRVSNPDRVSDTLPADGQNGIAGGVESNGDGVPLAYHVTNQHPGNVGVARLQWQRVAARTTAGKPTVLHLFDRKRPEQTRGVPYLAPVIEELRKLGEYSDAELTAALVSAMYTVFVKSDADQQEVPIAGETESGGNLEDNELKLGSGAVLSLSPGEEVQFANPARPNAAFDPFVLAILRQVGVGLELPYELLVKHFTASYSASRAALEMAWQFFRRRRLWLARRLCQPVYEWCIEEAVATGRLNRPGFFEDPLLRYAYLKASWIGPNRISVDPLKEANADKIDVLDLRVKTREQVCLERAGGDWDTKVAQIDKEEARLRQAGIGSTQPADNGAAAASADQPEPNSDAEDETAQEAEYA